MKFEILVILSKNQQSNQLKINRKCTETQVNKSKANRKGHKTNKDSKKTTERQPEVDPKLTAN